jgi:hypothetical protein
VRASLCAALAVAALSGALATACESGAKDTYPSTASTPTGGQTTTIRMGSKGKYADIQTGVLTSKTTWVWEMEIGGGVILRCVQNFLTYEHCKKVRSR